MTVKVFLECSIARKGTITAYKFSLSLVKLGILPESMVLSDSTKERTNYGLDQFLGYLRALWLLA